MRKILITGGSGTLGRYVVNRFSGDSVLAPSRADFDITNQEQVIAYILEHRPTVVAHLAAMTNVDACQQEPELAHQVNALGTQYLAQACREIGAAMVYVSTAAVFNGKKDCFYETDRPDPVNIYGQTKLEGEEAVRSLVERHIIIRSAWLIGGGRQEKKFISYIMQAAETQTEIEAVDDKVGTITYAKELADRIYQLVETAAYGLYHYGSTGSCSRYQIAQEVIRLLGKSITVKPVPSSRFESTFSAPRPAKEVIGSNQLAFPCTWEESLATYITQELTRSS